MPNVIMTPHNAFNSKEAFLRIFGHDHREHRELHERNAEQRGEAAVTGIVKRTYYFDYAATTRLIRRFCAMKLYFTDKFGNPSNLYGFDGKRKLRLTRRRKR